MDRIDHAPPPTEPEALQAGGLPSEEPGDLTAIGLEPAASETGLAAEQGSAPLARPAAASVAEHPSAPVGGQPAGAAAPQSPAPRVQQAATDLLDEEPLPDTAMMPETSPKKMPCFHCGTMTSVRVLQKTGDLCWRCYLPVGYVILKSLFVVAGILVVVASLLISWHFFFQDKETGRKTTVGQDRPKEFTREQKVAFLRRNWMDNVPLSELCTEYQFTPNEFRRWQEQLFEDAEAAGEKVPVRESSAVERRLSAMDQRLQLMGKILAELKDTVVQLRAESGQYEGTPAQRYILDSSGPPPSRTK